MWFGVWHLFLDIVGFSNFTSLNLGEIGNSERKFKSVLNWLNWTDFWLIRSSLYIWNLKILLTYDAFLWIITPYLWLFISQFQLKNEKARSRTLCIELPYFCKILCIYMDIEEKPGRLHTTLLAVAYPWRMVLWRVTGGRRPSPLTVCYCIMLIF